MKFYIDYFNMKYSQNFNNPWNSFAMNSMWKDFTSLVEVSKVSTKEDGYYLLLKFLYLQVILIFFSFSSIV